MAASRIERLMNIVAYLTDAVAPKTIREIIATIPGYPESFNSARRAFERDKEDLRAMGFDVVVKNNPDGDLAYQIQSETTFFNVDLTSKQRSILEYALGVYGPEEKHSVSALTKLGGMNPENEINEVTPLAMPEAIETLLEASTSQQRVRFTFRNTKREVLPKRVIAKGGYWYVEAFDIDKQEDRTFRADRISEVEIASDQIEREPTSTIPEESDDDVELHTIKVRVHPNLKESFMRTWNAELDDNGDLSFEIPRSDIFIQRIIDYAGFVAVIEPAEIAEQIESNIALSKSALEGA